MVLFQCIKRFYTQERLSGEGRILNLQWSIFLQLFILLKFICEAALNNKAILSELLWDRSIKMWFNSNMDDRFFCWWFWFTAKYQAMVQETCL